MDINNRKVDSEASNLNSKRTIHVIDSYEDPTNVKRDDKILNLQNMTPCLICCGQSKSGKSTIILNVILKRIIHEIENLDQLIFFSKTMLEYDLSYRPILYHYGLQKKSMKIYREIDFDIIEEVCEKLKCILKRNLTIKNKKDKEDLKPYYFIFDDILGDKQLGWFNTKLCNFVTYCRQANITLIINTQDYNAIPT